MANREPVQAEPGSCRFGASRLLPLLDNFEKEIGGVRAAKDSEYIHRMRVASRRLRAALPLFPSCFTDKQNRAWQGEIRTITKALGEARDTDVQIDFLRTYAKQLRKKSGARDGAANPDPLLREIETFLDRMNRRRDVLQDHVISALAGLEKSGVISEMRTAFGACLSPGHRIPRSAIASGLPAEAAENISSRLKEFLAYEQWLADPDAITEHHAMRIAAKKLRYTLEVYAPVYKLGLKKQLRSVKKVQEILGDIHDCDVWIDTLTGMIVKQRTRSRIYTGHGEDRHTLSGIQFFLHNREKTRRLLHRRMLQYWGTLTRVGMWNGLKESLTAGRKTAYRIKIASESETARAAVRAVASETGEEIHHAGHVTGLALSLFDQTLPLHMLGNRERVLLEYAGLLHDIGMKYGQKGHSARSRSMILHEERLPLDLPEKAIIGIVVHAHRKGIRPEADPLFPILAEKDRLAALFLSAILRVADGLDYLHLESVDGIECTIADKTITCSLRSERDISSEKNRAMVKSDLFCEVFQRQLVL